jgi:hypothetical protein
MATAIPPRAAEVASNSPRRQKLLWRGVDGGSSTSLGPVLGVANLRRGTDDLRKIKKNFVGETYFWKARLWCLRAELKSQKIQESGFKKFRNTFFNEIRLLN